VSYNHISTDPNHSPAVTYVAVVQHIRHIRTFTCRSCIQKGTYSFRGVLL